MNSLIYILSQILGIFGGIVSIYLLCITCPSNSLTIDYIGIIIGILAILVTLLVAWNIYTAIGVDQRVNNALRQQNELQRNQERRLEDYRQEIDSKIESIQSFTSSKIEQQIKTKVESAKFAYIALFNTTQAQVSVVIEDKEYLQQYSYFQTALNALLKCNDFPSDIRFNIKVLLDEMKTLVNQMYDEVKEVENKTYYLHEEDKQEFIQNIENISKSSREEFSFEYRQLFMEIATKAKKIFEGNLAKIKSQVIDS